MAFNVSNDYIPDGGQEEKGIIVSANIDVQVTMLKYSQYWPEYIDSYVVPDMDELATDYFPSAYINVSCNIPEEDKTQPFLQ